MLELLDPDEHWHWLRYPYLHEGDTLAKRRAVRARLHERGYRIAQVTLDYEDYLWNSPYARCTAQRDRVYDADPDAASKNGGTLLEQWLEALCQPGTVRAGAH